MIEERREEDEPIVYVSCETVWQDITRNQRLRNFQTYVSIIDLPCSLNRRRYAPGETIDTVFAVCSRRFLMTYPQEREGARVWVTRLPTGEPIGLVFVRNMVNPTENDDTSSSIDSLDTPSFEEGFSDDEEWGNEADDHDY